MTDHNNTPPICYPYLTGALEQTLKGLTYDLIANELVGRDQREVLQKLINEKIERAIAAEREYTYVRQQLTANTL
jgi:hypothetical protein